ncbi:FAD-dependent monooxygenase [Altererythrobacter sp. KTW20L]|uniref:FAD-dependent oxidoreductase n=1 Tax=Altererythrobacter sp. KTW20L TaxID=2942210 RepID=UPI0020C12AC1|nr:NAD(P)/FAD-dependent oxidoreductase [Altererythrobacter sp. KTW20L]MCL6250683.1 FAD-dependent monooxygenase [Altererythrobacter sp. KTW20L]
MDIGIAGCGIGGLAAALLLHRQGHHVTLYDRFPAPRPVGSGLMLQPTGMAVLDRMGLAAEALACGAPIQRLHGLNREGVAVLEADYADLGMAGVFGIGIHRASLFDVLHRAVMAAGIAILTDHQVRVSTAGADSRRLHFTDRDAAAAHELVVDCMGVGSPLAPAGDSYLPFGALWCTMEWPEDGPFDASLLEQRYENAGKMAGVLPTGRRGAGGVREFSFFWSLQQADHAAWQANSLAQFKAEVTDLWPQCDAVLDQLQSPEQMVFACYAHRSFAPPVEDRLVHIGDAWHSASPQLGQGANTALLDAFALSMALESEGELQHRLELAIALRRNHVRLYQWLTAAFTPLYQSASAWPAMVRDLLLAPASRIAPGPAIKARLVAGLAGSPLEALGLALPDYAALRAP